MQVVHARAHLNEAVEYFGRGPVDTGWQTHTKGEETGVGPACEDGHPRVLRKALQRDMQLAQWLV